MAENVKVAPFVIREPGFLSRKLAICREVIQSAPGAPDGATFIPHFRIDMKDAKIDPQWFEGEMLQDVMRTK